MNFARGGELFGLLVASCAIAGLLGFSGDTPVAAATERSAAPVSASSKAGIAQLVPKGSPIASFYGARGFRPFWTDDSAAQLVEMLGDAEADGLDPASFPVEELKRLQAVPNLRPNLDVALTQAFVSYVRALRTPAKTEEMVYVDAALAPDRQEQGLLQSAAAAPSLRAHLNEVRRMHPLYESLRFALARLRRDGDNGTGLPDARYEQLLVTNMDRLRALPANPARRYILVDTASARLWLYENGQPRDEMRVIVGKQQMQTPVLAGLIRYAVRNPYWNLPPDLIRARAAEVARSGPEVLEREQIELLSGWDADAWPLDPSEVDWAQVAAGTKKLRMRQLPGADNMMGSVKFMLPNRLGIYLHDTPQRGYFARDDRRLSSGCVRVADAPRLSRWLLQGAEPDNFGMPEERVDLPEPVPVFLVYLTALPERGKIVVQRDGYNLDKLVKPHSARI
ncbi:MAG TPA: L,D-transpeptidase family protein [Sphingomicrobium sp.]